MAEESLPAAVFLSQIVSVVNSLVWYNLISALTYWKCLFKKKKKEKAARFYKGH